MKADPVSEHADTNPEGISQDATTIRLIGVSLVAVMPGVLALAIGFWPGVGAGEGGQLAAPSSPKALAVDTTEQQQVDAAMRAVRDVMIAVFSGLGALGMGASGLMLAISGQIRLGATLCLKASVLALLLALLVGPIFHLRDPHIMPAHIPQSAISHVGESQ